MIFREKGKDKGSYAAIRPENLGWIEYRLTTQEMDYVWRCIKNKKENVNKSLVGNIDSSYKLLDRGDWFWLNTVKPLCVSYVEEFENVGDRAPVMGHHPFVMKEWWVNYQKQHEFNPTHNHTGVYSFVIWMKIPTSFKKQSKKKFAAKSNRPLASAFAFSYIDVLGGLKNHVYHLEPEDVGTMLFFPAKLEHCVYPFYDCDEDRISVSGNIALNTLKRL